MIKTVIFDIGGVLVGYDWTAYLMRLFNNDEALVTRLKANIFGDHWSEVDRGVLSEDELIDLFTENAPDLRNEVLHFWNNAGDVLWQFDFTKDWIKDLKKRGYQVLFLSNWSSHLREQAGEKLDFLELMDGGVFSYKVKLIKPDHRIYEEIIKKYNLNPEECVFLDDKEKNVIAARECGMNAVQVINHEIAVEGLEKLLAK